MSDLVTVELPCGHTRLITRSLAALEARGVFDTPMMCPRCPKEDPCSG